MTDSYSYQPVVDEERETSSPVNEEKHSSDALLTSYTSRFRSDSGHRRLFGVIRAYGIHALLLIFNVGWTLLILYRPSPTISTADLFDVPSPANHAAPFERIVMNNSLWTENRFKGDPNPEQTKAWVEFHELTEIAVSGEDLAAIGKKSVQLKDGPNRYIAMLDVFHQLHCLDKIRTYMHSDYYTMIEHPQMQKIHVHHCLDSLREIIMCRADTELVTFEYVSEERYKNPRPNPDFMVERKCRNWDALVDWVQKHSASIKDVESRQEWEEKYGPPTSFG